MSTPENTRIFLIYTNEEITTLQAADSRIVPIRLVPQTMYGTSEVFRRITEADIPAHIQYVGFATPAFTQKTGRPLTDIQHPGNPNTVVAFQKGGMFWNRFTYITIASKNYPHFATLWAWLLSSMNQNPYSVPYYRRHIYDNYWIAEKETALKYTDFAKKIMNLLDSAPAPIQMMLYADSKSKSDITNTGFPYVSYHSLLVERCIMYFCDTNKIDVL